MKTNRALLAGCAAGALALAACSSNMPERIPATVAVTASPEPTTEPSFQPGLEVVETATPEPDEVVETATPEPEVVPDDGQNLDQATSEMCFGFLQLAESPSGDIAQLILDRLGESPPADVTQELQSIVDSDGQDEATVEATASYIAPICGLDPADFTGGITP